MKIKFNSDDDFPLSKIIEIRSMIIVVRAVFMKITNITQKFSQENVYINYEKIQMLYYEELMLIRQTYQKNAIFVTICIF